MKKKYQIEIELDTEVRPYERGMGNTSIEAVRFERGIACQIEHILNQTYGDMITTTVSIADHNAETLEDKLRDEHHNISVPEEREDANLFEFMAEKFKPKYEETNGKSKT